MSRGPPIARGGVLVGVAPFAMGDRLVNAVVQAITGIWRNEGATLVRQPQ